MTASSEMLRVREKIAKHRKSIRKLEAIYAALEEEHARRGIKLTIVDGEAKGASPHGRQKNPSSRSR